MTVEKLFETGKDLEKTPLSWHKTKESHEQPALVGHRFQNVHFLDSKETWFIWFPTPKQRQPGKVKEGLKGWKLEVGSVGFIETRRNEG